MIQYLVNWLHLYSIHLGALVAILLLFDLYLKGLPEVKEMPGKFKSALIMSMGIALFSSHFHNHLVHYLLKEIK